MAGNEPVAASAVRGTGSGRSSLIRSLISSVTTLRGRGRVEHQVPLGVGAGQREEPVPHPAVELGGLGLEPVGRAGVPAEPRHRVHVEQDVRSGIRPSVAQLFSRAMSAVGMPRPAPW